MSNLYWKWDSAIPKDICEHIIKNVNWEKKRNRFYYKIRSKLF